jgi:hypothetical protein
LRKKTKPPGSCRPFRFPLSIKTGLQGACRNLVPDEQKNKIARFLQALLASVEQKNRIARFLQEPKVPVEQKNKTARFLDAV